MNDDLLDQSYPTRSSASNLADAAHSAHFLPLIDTPALQRLSASPQNPDPCIPAQKRQNSMSAYANNPSNKRTPNPLLMQLPLQSHVPGALNYSNSASAARLNAAPASRRPVRKQPLLPTPMAALHSQQQALQLSLHPQMKTPTPSTYDVPSSPTAIQASIHNNSDLSASSPAIEPPSAVPKPAEPLSQPPLPSTAPSQRAMSDEEQQLATKLKETYKNIVNFEEVVQKSCIDLTVKINLSAFSNSASSYQSAIYGLLLPVSGLLPNLVSSSTELSNDLWTIYHHNITLLNNYHDFLITALKPTANTTQFKTGRNIVNLYKIPRRMWVYGIVGFLEVLKNIMSVFQDHEIFLCFIAYCFSVVSNLTDPALEMEGWWCEKLGDLSRMAIALYSSRFIDWKISAEYWYAVSMKTMYGHGKIYYHMCTVQQDNLDALVNIGKSVICRDPFVPTQQYLRLVVENICTQRNILSLLELPIIDFIKIHKVLLSIYTNQTTGISNSDSTQQSEVIPDAQLQYGIDLVTRYGLTFGCDSHGYNFFTRTFCVPGGTHSKYGSDPFNSYLKQQHEQEQQANTLDTIEKMNFWFNKGSLFAIANINHLIGFGDPKNPFAKLFQLPEALKERKDKKDKKRKSKSLGTQEEGFGDMSYMLNNNMTGPDSPLLLASDLSVIDWFHCLSFINKSVLELSFRILNYYLIGPKQASTCHVIVWLYFLMALEDSIDKYPNSRNMFMWLFRKFFPWESLVNYLNTILSVVSNNKELSSLCCKYIMNVPNYVEHFNGEEFLPEVWKCWGSLWFDVVCPKLEYDDVTSAGILNYDLFDMPNCGTSPAINISNQSGEQKSKKKDQLEHDNNERLVRIILLARLIADKNHFGLVRTAEGFRFDEAVHAGTESHELISSAAPGRAEELFSFVLDLIFSDGRLVQNNFVIPLSADNLVSPEVHTLQSAEDKDAQWFHFNHATFWEHEEEDIFWDDVVNDEDMDAYPDSDFEDENIGYEGSGRREHNTQDNREHYGASHDAVGGLQRNSDTTNIEDFYNVVNNHYLPQMSSETQIEGDLGDLMDTSLTYITLDTNIWLKHCGRIFKSVRSKAFKVLIPLIVFQELRSLRKSAEATIADAATRSVIIIRELYFAREIMPLRFDGTVASDINETTEFENNSKWMSSVDLTMLNVVSEHDEISKKLLKGLNSTIHGSRPTTLDSKSAKSFRYCILITDDRNMRLRAKTSGVTSYQSKWLFSQLESAFSDKCID